MRRILDRERRGFAISLGIMLTYLLVAIVCSVTTYFAQAFEMERFFADVTASTCVMASRYGGSESDAYKIQVGGSTIEETANRMLGYVASKSATSFAVVRPVNGKYISVSRFPDPQGNVHVELHYSVAPGAARGPASLFSAAFESPIRQSFTLPSLMQNGKLIKR